MQQEAQIAKDQDAKVFYITNLYFGRLTYENEFAIEYKAGSGSIQFNSSTRQIRIATKTGADVVIWLREIFQMDVDQENYSIIFSLENNCMYESETRNFKSDRYDLLDALKNLGLGEDKILLYRQSFHHLNDTTSAYTSNLIKCFFKTSSEMTKFLIAARELKMVKPFIDSNLKIMEITRNLYSTTNLKNCFDWFSTLNLKIAFQLEKTLRNLLLDPTEVIYLKPIINDLVTKHTLLDLQDILMYFNENLSGYEKFGTTADAFEEITECLKDAISKHRRIPIIDDESIYQCHSVTATPTALNLEGPYPEQSNRVIRLYKQYSDYFLRVSFTDEDHLMLRLGRNIDRKHYLESRIGALLNGFQLCGRQFEFLGYSASALKTHSVFFVTPFIMDNVSINADKIRRNLGDFAKEIYYPARLGARLSQAFSSTSNSITLLASELKEIDDIVNPLNKNCFTDGVGMVSSDLAKRIWKTQKNSSKRHGPPSAFQFRLGGLKGVVTVNSDLPGSILQYRDSMNKFTASHLTDFEICKSFTKAGPCMLNRPLIKILEDLGIPPEVFLELQHDAVEEIKRAKDESSRLLDLLDVHGLGTSFKLVSILKKLEQFDIDYKRVLDQNEMFKFSVDAAILHVCRELKNKARIPVPGSYTMVGVADEWKFLKEGQVYACVYDNVTREEIYLSGRVSVSRSPAIHPGTFDLN